MEPQKTFTPHGAPIHDAALLPVQPPKQVIGRNRELGSMHKTLKIGAPIFLSGMPGIGKTALASVLAAAHIASNPGGVLWFPIFEDDFTQLVTRVGRAYGVNALTNASSETSVAESIDVVKALLEKNRPLIILDGLIDIDAARDFVRLCASGIPVILINETAGPGPWTPISLDALSEADSNALFKQVSALTDSLYSPDIEGLCKFLGGVPLALELAARRCFVDDLTPAELLSALPSSTGHDAHLMMVSLTFKALAPSVQAMIIVLSAMFTGSATAEMISDVSDVPAANVVPLMQQLVARGLATQSIIYGQYAFTLHETAVQYTRTWLNQYQRLTDAENRALRGVIKYTERHAQNDPARHDRLAAEMQNMVGAAAFATSSGQAGALRTLIAALNQKAGDFVPLRGFGLELDQMMKLSTLFSPSVMNAPHPPSAPDTQPVRTEAKQSQPTTIPPTHIPEAVELGDITQPEEATVPRDIPELNFDADTTRQSPASSLFDEPNFDSQATPAITYPATLPTAQSSTDDLLALEEPSLFLGDTQIPETTPSTPLPVIEETQPNEPFGSFDLSAFDTTQQTAAQDQDAKDDVDNQFMDQFLNADQSANTSANTAETLADLNFDDLDSLFGVEDVARTVVETPAVIAEPPHSLEDTAIPTEHSLPTVQTQLETARQDGDKPKQAKLLYTLGRYYAQQGERIQALGHQKQALELYESLDDSDGMLVTLEALAEITAQVDDAEGAVVYATRGANLARKLGDQTRLGRLLTRLADVRMALGDIPTAIQTYSEAAEIIRGTEDWFQIGVIMSKLGNAYIEQRMFQESIMMLEQSLVIFYKEQRTDYAGRVLGSIGAAYNGLQQWDKAKGYFMQALSLSRQNDDRAAEAAHLASLAVLSRMQDNRDEAVDYYRQALHVANLMGDIDLQSEFTYELGSLLIEHPSTIQMGLQLLKESDALVPRSEARQLINRATKRIERARNAGMELPPPESSSGDYASKVYRWDV